MKTEKNIFLAFLLNFFFSVFEFFGGIFTGSVAILSDAVHDIGDAASIGAAYFLEKKSKRKPNEVYTYGYARFSVLGSVITTFILLFGSIAVIYNAVHRLIYPLPIYYDGMILFALVGAIVNLFAAFLTKEKGSLNQKAVNLQMLEDVLGWIVVFLGAIAMKFTNFTWLDPLLSICVAVFILINATKNLKEIFNIFIIKAPQGLQADVMQEHLSKTDGVASVHHIHVWTLDGQTHCATLHVIINNEPEAVKKRIREKLKEIGVAHVTIETERENEPCDEHDCQIKSIPSAHHHHHHHHGHAHKHGCTCEHKHEHDHHD